MFYDCSVRTQKSQSQAGDNFDLSHCQPRMQNELDLLGRLSLMVKRPSNGGQGPRIGRVCRGRSAPRLSFRFSL